MCIQITHEHGVLFNNEMFPLRFVFKSYARPNAESSGFKFQDSNIGYFSDEAQG